MDTIRTLDELMAAAKTDPWLPAERSLYNKLVRRIRKLERDEQSLTLSRRPYAAAAVNHSR